MPGQLGRSPLLLAVVFGAMVLVGCGANPDPTSLAAVADYLEINASGHGDDDTEGHDLAVGDNTPKDAQGRYVLHHGDTGPDVTALQDRLVALGAPLTSPTGAYGDQTLAAVLLFQRAEGLTPDGVVGTSTWAALDAPTATVTWDLGEIPTEHATDSPRPTTADAPSSPSTSEKARTGDAAGSHRPTATEDDPAPATGWAKAVVTLADQTATFFDTSGTIVLQAPISSGKSHLTPTGTFFVQSKSPRAYAGTGSGVYMDSMTRFNGGIGFHSIPKTTSGQDLPTPLGQVPVSHGCIRMHDDQAKLVFENLPIGAVVEVHS